jgi:hypothetical protein
MLLTSKSQKQASPSSFPLPPAAPLCSQPPPAAAPPQRQQADATNRLSKKHTPHLHLSTAISSLQQQNHLSARRQLRPSADGKYLKNNEKNNKKKHLKTLEIL